MLQKIAVVDRSGTSFFPLKFAIMSNQYLNRLCFLDKISYDRAYVEFRVDDNESSDENDENSFLLSLLDSGNNFEPTTVRNALNFARSWVEFGKTLSKRVMTRILYLSFLDPSFMNQVMNLSDIVSSKKWIYHGLLKIIRLKFDEFKESIKNDHPIWDLLVDEFLRDANSKQQNLITKYEERRHSYLIEVIPLHWPSEKTKNLDIPTLNNLFITFCLNEAKSDTAFKLVNALCFVYPVEVSYAIHGFLHKLSTDAILILLRYGLIQIPESDEQNGAVLAAKLLIFSPDTSLRLALSDKNTKERDAIIDMIKHFDPLHHSFVLEL